MGAWYWIGVFAGIGAAIGLAAAALLTRTALALVVSTVVAGVLGYFVSGAAEAAAGVAGAVLSSLGAAPLVAGTLRRGGTRGGTAVIIAGIAVVAAALAFVPVLGYIEALAVPALGLRLRRRAPDTHAGLRSLTK
ncbi:MAG TPA: hypothetical protein VGU02_04525 [Gaiellaceae bacterium]|nr:hypothetical protein [Gaiellaceae bacterium]